MDRPGPPVALQLHPQRRAQARSSTSPPSPPPYSPSCRGALQRKEGDVVLLLPALPYEGVKLLHQEGAQRPLILTVMGDERPKPREAEHLTLGVVCLYQPVAVEEDALPNIEFDLLLFVAHPRHESQGHTPGS